MQWYVAKETMCADGGNVNWYGHYVNGSRVVPRKLKIELLYDPITPLLELNSKEIKSVPCRGTCTPAPPMVILALFMIGKRWKQPQRCGKMDEWIKNYYIHTQWNVTQL